MAKWSLAPGVVEQTPVICLIIELMARVDPLGASDSKASVVDFGVADNDAASGRFSLAVITDMQTRGPAARLQPHACQTTASAKMPMLLGLKYYCLTACR